MKEPGKKDALPGKYLTFEIEGNSYGAPIESVREIIRMMPVVHIPETPDCVVGAINLRGKVTPVVDLRMRMHLPSVPPTKMTCIIVVEGDGGPAGVIVDAVHSVIDLKRDQIEEKPKLGGTERFSFVNGMGKIKEQMIILIDIAAGLRDLESCEALIEARGGKAAS